MDPTQWNSQGIYGYPWESMAWLLQQPEMTKLSKGSHWHPFHFNGGLLTSLAAIGVYGTYQQQQ
jgi:hypothetical protein